MTDAETPAQATPSRAACYLLWALCAAWAGVIFWFSALPGSQVVGGSSELGHFGEYFIFGALLYSALRASGQHEHAAAAALIVASLYGMTDELHQHFVVMRTPDVVDWGVDTLGAACGIMTVAMAAAFANRAKTSRPAEDPA